MLKKLILLSVITSDHSYGKIYSSFSHIAEQALKGVVNIRTTQFVKGKNGLLDPYQFFLKGRLPKSTKNHSLGSGVIFSSNGYIITNYHVIKGASKIEILLAKRKKKYNATVVGTDSKTDLALLKVTSNAKLKPLSFGNSNRLKIGDIVLAIGNPFGYAHTVTSGIISAKGRVIGTGPYDNFLQTDAPIHPGNSGGPLLDIRGRVVGINTATATDAYGIGFAIPSNTVKTIVKDLKRYGKVVRPWLGIVGKNVLSGDELGNAYDPSGVYGVIIDNLIVDGPAIKSGLRIGDLILSVGKKKIFDLNELQRLLNKNPPNTIISLRVFRRGRGYLTVSIKLSEIPKSEDLPDEKDLF